MGPVGRTGYPPVSNVAEGQWAIRRDGVKDSRTARPARLHALNDRQLAFTSADLLIQHSRRTDPRRRSGQPAAALL
ncbi:hypothetical protein GCM10009759_14530 [Kitasatospora saccharophila]|uniref:Uncharacterized protein n=1 Tax=Kitasatospora saccharophila TaxID=407973 RepID=A0ABN2WEM7_9ACTN